MDVLPSVVPPDVLLHLPGRLVEIPSYSLRLHRIVVRCDHDLPCGTLLRVVFLTPSGPLSLHGTVRWVRDGEIGIVFGTLAPAQRAELRRILALHGRPDRSGVRRAPS